MASLHTASLPWNGSVARVAQARARGVEDPAAATNLCKAPPFVSCLAHGRQSSPAPTCLSKWWGSEPELQYDSLRSEAYGRYWTRAPLSCDLQAGRVASNAAAAQQAKQRQREGVAWQSSCYLVLQLLQKHSQTEAGRADWKDSCGTEHDLAKHLHANAPARR